jgi:hypothetical protein
MKALSVATNGNVARMNVPVAPTSIALYEPLRDAVS